MKKSDMKLGYIALALAAVLPLQAADTIRLNSKPGNLKVRIEGTSNIHDWQVEGKLIGGYMEVGQNFPLEPGKAVEPGKVVGGVIEPHLDVLGVLDHDPARPKVLVGGAGVRAVTGTVGAAALDLDGNLAVGNSTGGTFFKYPGRVGDTPIIGCGLYADNALGSAVCTGVGEQIMKTVLAKTTVDQIVLLGDAGTAARVAIGYYERRIGGQGGVICLSPGGEVGWAFSTPHMGYAYRTAEMEAVTAKLGVLGPPAFTL